MSPADPLPRGQPPRGPNRRPSRTRRGLLALSVLGLAVAAVLAHEGHDVLPSKGATVQGNVVILSPAGRKALDVRTADVMLRDLERAILAPAVVALQPQAHAFATTQLGGRVERVLVKPGQTVRAGEVLALVRSPDLQKLELEEATARAELELAEQALARTTELVRQQAQPERELLLARNRRQEKANALHVARLKLRAVEVDPAAPGLVPVRSPITGVASHADLSPGMVVEPTRHLCEIIDAGRLRLRALVAEAYVDQVAVGQPVTVRLAGRTAETWPARAAAREGRVNPRTLTETVWLDFDRPPPGLVPGLTGQARVVVERRPKAVAVPERAVVRDGMETFVFLQREPGRYERVALTVGLTVPGYVEALGGVFPDAPVVVQGNRQLASLFVQGTLRPGAEARKNYALRTEPVARHPVAPVVELDAVLEVPPQQKTTAAPLLAGKVVELGVTQPGPVAAGTGLVRLASLEFQNLQLELIQAELAARLHQETLESYRRADPQGQGLVPRQFVQEAAGQLAVARERRDHLRRLLLTLGLGEEEVTAVQTEGRLRDSYWLRAARAGQALPIDLALGQVVKEGQPLFEIQDAARLWVRGRVEEPDRGAVRPGQPARVRMGGQLVAAGAVGRVDALPVDPAAEGEEAGTRRAAVRGGQTWAAWVELDNAAGRWRENQLGRLAVEAGPPAEALAVPVTALYREGSQWLVFVYESAKDRFTPRRVTLGRRDDRFAEVVAGLAAGEVVAVTAVADLQRALGRIK